MGTSAPSEPCTRGYCGECGRLVAFARSLGSGVPLVWEADPGGAWRPLATFQGPMRRVGRAEGSYRRHECGGAAEREHVRERVALDVVLNGEPAAVPASPRLFAIDGGIA